MYILFVILFCCFVGTSINMKLQEHNDVQVEEKCIKAVSLAIRQCSACVRDFELTPPGKKM